MSCAHTMLRHAAAPLAGVLALAGLLGATGCMTDKIWIDEVTVVLQDPANALVALSVPAEEGNIGGGHYNPYDYGDTGVILGEVYGAGEQHLELVTATADQRANVWFVVWADDPDVGYVHAPDCEEFGTRFMPELDEEAIHLVLPSAENPLSWCGALMGPEGTMP